MLNTLPNCKLIQYMKLCIRQTKYSLEKSSLIIYHHSLLLLKMFRIWNICKSTSFTFFAIVNDPCFHFSWTVKRFKLSMGKGQKIRKKKLCTLTSYKFSDTPSKPIKNKLTKHFFYLELNDLFDGMKDDCATFWLVINFCHHLYIHIIQLSIFSIVKINLTSCPPPPLCHILFVCEICIKSVLSDSVKI